MTARRSLTHADDPVLEEDDAIDIPRRPSSVSVLGQVYSPTSVLARPGLRVQEYLALAGGPTTLADTKHIMVIKADGEIMTSDGYTSAERNTHLPVFAPAFRAVWMRPRSTSVIRFTYRTRSPTLPVCRSPRT